MSLLALLPEGPPAQLLALALNAALCAGILSRSALEPLRGKTISIIHGDCEYSVCCLPRDGSPAGTHRIYIQKSCGGILSSSKVGKR